MDFDQLSGKAGLRPLGIFETMRRAIGIVHPQRVAAQSLHASFMDLKEAHGGRPLVFFPECTKTNGRGILDFPEEALGFIK